MVIRFCIMRLRFTDDIQGDARTFFSNFEEKNSKIAVTCQN